MPCPYQNLWFNRHLRKLQILTYSNLNPGFALTPLAAITSGVQDATGKAPRRFEDFARDYATMFG
ncbi:MAG: hypothetical protein KME30_08975 [Iphinoe sp. HA4291-MV1]|jgi:hypothetical protein|nr:hypothetical protein [Iphinoe sp. HA4291-MV1]